MKNEGESSSVIARSIGITVRRVNQVWREYKDTENIPVIGEHMGIPPDLPLSEREKEIVREVKQKYKLGARRLELLIDRDYKIHISHNRIHKFLLEDGLAQSNAKKQKRRRWVRYERKHSMTAGHIDWHDTSDGKGVCAIEDDSSRKILAYGEFDYQNTENSKKVFKMVVDDFWKICPMEELIMDHSSVLSRFRRAKSRCTFVHRLPSSSQNR